MNRPYIFFMRLNGRGGLYVLSFFGAEVWWDFIGRGVRAIRQSSPYIFYGVDYITAGDRYKFWNRCV